MTSVSVNKGLGRNVLHQFAYSGFTSIHCSAMHIVQSTRSYKTTPLDASINYGLDYRKLKNRNLAIMVYNVLVWKWLGNTLITDHRVWTEIEMINDLRLEECRCNPWCSSVISSRDEFSTSYPWSVSVIHSWPSPILLCIISSGYPAERDWRHTKTK